MRERSLDHSTEPAKANASVTVEEGDQTEAAHRAGARVLHAVARVFSSPRLERFVTANVIRSIDFVEKFGL